MNNTKSKKDAKNREKIVRELIIKARFLNYFTLFSIIVFSILVIKLYPNWRGSKLLFIFAVFMEIFSFWFFIYLRRILGILRTNPSDQEIVNWADFLSHYYVPKFIFRRKRNPYIVRDDDE